MTIEDIREYKKNAVEILRKHDQYATAKAVEEAFMALACLGQYMWERDVAISQLEELGLSLGQEVDYIKELINKDRIRDAIYKDGIFVCPNCGMSTFPLAKYGGEHCLCCNQRIRWREIIK